MVSAGSSCVPRLSPPLSRLPRGSHSFATRRALTWASSLDLPPVARQCPHSSGAREGRVLGRPQPPTFSQLFLRRRLRSSVRGFCR